MNTVWPIGSGLQHFAPTSDVLWDEMVQYFGMTRPPSILKLSEDKESKEPGFEPEYLRSLSFEERLTMMRKKSKEMLKQLVELGYRKPSEIVKRSSR